MARFSQLLWLSILALSASAASAAPADPTAPGWLPQGPGEMAEARDGEAEASAKDIDSSGAEASAPGSESGETEGDVSEEPAATPPAKAEVDDVKRAGATGELKGLITDEATGEPLPGASVTAIKGGEARAESGDDGRFALELPVGRYVLQVYAPLYEHRVVRGVRARAGRAIDIEVALRLSPSAIEEVTVYAEPASHTEAGMLQKRRQSISVADGMSRQEMSRGGDSSASDAVKRMVSATVEDGRYVLIRGLGGRYVSTLLNGVTLPSPEPDRQAVPLDLFPTSLLANLNIVKSYSARYPGTFGGGTMLIESNSYPEELAISAKVSTSVDTVTTSEEVPAYSGGSLDVIGFDDGSRALPAAIPRDRPARVSETLEPAAIEAAGESFANVWTADPTTGTPNLGLGLTVGDTLAPAGRKLGYLATIGYGRSMSRKEIEIAKVRSSGDGVEFREELESTSGSTRAKIGGLAAAGLELSKSHELRAVSLYTHDGESSLQNVSGLSESDGILIDSRRLRFVERSLSFSQLQGRHGLPHRELRWQGNIAFTNRDEPDTRDITYNVLDEDRRRYKNETGSGERFFAELGELSLGAGSDGRLELGPAAIQTGAIVRNSARQFSARRFRYAFVGSDPAVLFLPASEIFAPEHIGPDFRLEERTLPSDAYDANLLVAAAYSELEVAATNSLRLSGGLRYEVALQTLTPGSPFSVSAADPEDAVDRKDSDFLPALSAVYALTPEMNLRGAYSYTVARPMFRELAPFLFFDYTRRSSVSGNPELGATHIHNADGRWEWFSGDSDVLAAGVFYKRFVDPIEQVIVSAAGGDISYANAERAQALGGEIEARLALERFHRLFRGVRSWANFTLIRSRVTLGAEELGSQTSAERPLQGQSPYVVNAGLSYDRPEGGTSVALLYNVFGRRISEVGFDTLPDVYEEPFHRVDISANQRLPRDLSLGLSVANLLGERQELEQGGLPVYRYQPGVSVSLSLTWTPEPL